MVKNLTLNVFDGDPFDSLTMTGYVNEHIPFVPGFLSGMGLFSSSGIYTTQVLLQDWYGRLSLIPTSARGSAPSSPAPGGKAVERRIGTVRLAREAVITADEASGVRVLGSMTEMQTAERLVYNKIEGPIGLKAQLGYTLEHFYLGAINGSILDADGEEIWNYFQTYNVAQPAEVAVDFEGLTTDTSKLADQARVLRRRQQRELGGLSMAAARPVALCGDNFFDKMWGNKETVEARKHQAQGRENALSILGDSEAYDALSYGKVLWVNYQGDDGGPVSIPTDEARMFVHGVPGLFHTFYGPGDTEELVNTEGLPSYMIQRRERQTSSMRVFEVQSNPVPICLRPKHLQRLTIKAAPPIQA